MDHAEGLVEAPILDASPAEKSSSSWEKASTPVTSLPKAL